MNNDPAPCHYWTDPETGKRHLIPGCWGRITGHACTCDAVRKRAYRAKRLDPIADDWAKAVKEADRLREENRLLRAKNRHQKERIAELKSALADSLFTVQHGDMANRESVPAVLVEDFDAADAHGPGAFMWSVNDGKRSMLFMLPGEDFLRAISVQEGQPADDRLVWGWDGNVESPTLTPSILAYDREGTGNQVESWHGYLTAGVFRSC